MGDGETLLREKCIISSMSNCRGQLERLESAISVLTSISDQYREDLEQLDLKLQNLRRK